MNYYIRFLEKSCLKIPFVFLQFTKKAQKAILWSRIHVFVTFVIFAGKLLSFRILHLACPKHVRTPCITWPACIMHIYLTHSLVLQVGIYNQLRGIFRRGLDKPNFGCLWPTLKTKRFFTSGSS